MGRMQSPRHGKSSSHRPPHPSYPTWAGLQSKEEIENIIVELAKEGYGPSMIGNILRDSYGVPLSKLITGKKITEILEENDLSMPIPEDLYTLIKKAINLRRHMEENPKDFTSKRGLFLLESKIHRLSKYYRRKKILPAKWKYSHKKAATLIK
ncbi:MAG: 30S ribosomal protein S15 [Candidatus Lokiarchaeota archaeon]|nr:30S ribosomal protein S15 [Candidatus Lokiarchaeota archaeon]